MKHTITFAQVKTRRFNDKHEPVFMIIVDGVPSKLQVCDPIGFLAGTEPAIKQAIPADIEQQTFIMEL